MSESLVGFRVAATRQKAGRLAYALPPRPPGATNWPASTTCANVIVAPATVTVESVSHGTAPKARDETKTTSNEANTRDFFIIPPCENRGQAVVSWGLTPIFTLPPE